MADAAATMKPANIPGWFPRLDQELFTFFLKDTAPEEARDVLELGCYLGRSAVHIGAFLRPEESLFVCDLFDPKFKGLTRAKFEANYRAVRGELPTVIQGPSASVADVVRQHSLRFVHVDASHDYTDVRSDIALVKQLVTDGAVVAFDDYRTLHAPGVAAAVWGAVERGEFQPLCLSRQKIYGTFGEPSPTLVQSLREMAEGRYEVSDHRIAGVNVLRVARPASPKGRGGLPASEALERIERRLGQIERQLEGRGRPTSSKSRPSVAGLVSQVKDRARRG